MRWASIAPVGAHCSKVMHLRRCGALLLLHVGDGLAEAYHEVLDALESSGFGHVFRVRRRRRKEPATSFLATAGCTFARTVLAARSLVPPFSLLSASRSALIAEHLLVGHSVHVGQSVHVPCGLDQGIC